MTGEVLEVEYKRTALVTQPEFFCIYCFKHDYTDYQQKSGNKLATIKIYYRYHIDTDYQRHACA